MANRVIVNICGDDYTLVAEESPSYMQRVGAYVDGKMREIQDSARVGRTNSAVLTAINIADERFKEQEASVDLRRQLKDLMEENAKLKTELSESKREIFKLQQKR